MRVLGIDPGTVRMGYALLLDEPVAIEEYGVLSQSRSLSLPMRLHRLHQDLMVLVDRLSPDEMALEEPFVSQDKNRRTGIAVGQAQAVGLIVAASADLLIRTYAPSTVKQAVTGYGGGSKSQVQEMVRLQLGLEEIPQPDDAADAIAVALCHLRTQETERLLSSREIG